MTRGYGAVDVSPRINPRPVRPSWRTREGKVGVWFHAEDGRSDGGDVKRSEAVSDVETIVPQMRFADECVGEADPFLSANGECCVVVWVNVVFE